MHVYVVYQICAYIWRVFIIHYYYLFMNNYYSTIIIPIGSDTAGEYYHENSADPSNNISDDFRIASIDVDQSFLT